MCMMGLWALLQVPPFIFLYLYRQLASFLSFLAMSQEYSLLLLQILRKMNQNRSIRQNRKKAKIIFKVVIASLVGVRKNVRQKWGFTYSRSQKLTRRSQELKEQKMQKGTLIRIEQSGVERAVLMGLRQIFRIYRRYRQKSSRVMKRLIKALMGWIIENRASWIRIRISSSISMLCYFLEYSLIIFTNSFLIFDCSSVLIQVSFKSFSVSSLTFTLLMIFTISKEANLTTRRINTTMYLMLMKLSQAFQQLESQQLWFPRASTTIRSIGPISSTPILKRRHFTSNEDSSFQRLGLFSSEVMYLKSLFNPNMQTMWFPMKKVKRGMKEYHSKKRRLLGICLWRIRDQLLIPQNTPISMQRRTITKRRPRSSFTLLKIDLTSLYQFTESEMRFRTQGDLYPKLGVFRMEVQRRVPKWKAQDWSCLMVQAENQMRIMKEQTVKNTKVSRWEL